MSTTTPSTPTTAPLHVIIIGAGTGGLCLAHGLKRAGIERRRLRARPHVRPDGLHGYRVGIDPDGSRALHALLPPDLYDTFVATCARAPRWFNMLTEQLGRGAVASRSRPTTTRWRARSRSAG